MEKAPEYAEQTEKQKGATGGRVCCLRRIIVDKKKLIVGHKYLRRRKTQYGGKPVEAESWLECVQITPAGAVFFGSAGLEKLTDKQIKE